MLRGIAAIDCLIINTSIIFSMDSMGSKSITYIIKIEGENHTYDGTSRF